MIWRQRLISTSSTSPESFVAAGKKGYGLMAIPLAGGKMAELIGQYREAW
jgi:hypothetical protein